MKTNTLVVDASGIVENVRIDPQAAAPGSPVESQLYFNNVDKKLYFYDGAQFISIESLPVGSVVKWPVPAIPVGYLECDGSAISRSTYNKLFLALATRYGIGDGATTFNIPDFRGYFVRGWDHGRGLDPDAASRVARPDGSGGAAFVGTTQATEIRSHTHDLIAYTIQYANDYGPGAYPEQAPTGTNTTTTHALDAVGGVQALGSDYRPYNIGSTFVIKY